MRRVVLVLGVLLAARAAPAASARLTLTPVKAHVGDAIQARIAVEAAAGETVDVAPLPVEWGKVQVLSGAWEPQTEGSATRVWSGTVAAYELGTIEVPPVAIPIMKDQTASSVATEAASLTIEATLPPGKTQGQEPDLVDLKPPASIPADLGPLKIALAVFALLLAAALAAWWLWRRYAAKLAAVRAPVDPFRRLPPHVWVYEELEKLLARRLAEEGRIGVFYDELTRIVKQYLEGRYRVELLERTTAEVPGALHGAGAPTDAGFLARTILESGDRVKFARDNAGPAECRAAVEEAYRLVDITKPAEAPLASAAAAS